MNKLVFLLVLLPFANGGAAPALDSPLFFKAWRARSPKPKTLNYY